ncbi:MAG: hypothetical protein GY822_28980 [Deltaproteobacteria bacterium]|nr:hypothetical protein [Deltaproteobacteria bacterium]
MHIVSLFASRILCGLVVCDSAARGSAISNSIGSSHATRLELDSLNGSTFRHAVATLFALSLLLAMPLIGGCEGCTQAPPDTQDSGEPAGGFDPEPGVRTCVIDSDCEDEGLCEGGICTEPVVIDAGTLTDGGNEAPQDAGAEPIGKLQVLPDALVEFGAQRLGVPVERDIVVVNVGNAPLTVLTVVLNNNEQSEFDASPVGNIGQELLPAEQLTFRVSHTPVDGRPDEGELNVLHTGFGNLTTVSFLAEFKGDPAFNVNDDVTALMDNVSEVLFGEVASDQTVTKRLFLRNTGRSDSLLEVSDLTLTPAEGDFSLDTVVELPVLLSSWASGLCPDDTTDECPEGTDACTAQVCVDAEGDPVNALVVDLTFAPGIAPATATFTIDTN